MSNNNNPFPALPPIHEWHEVPFGAIIPAYAPYAYTPLGGEGLPGVNFEGSWYDFAHDPDSGLHRFTPNPIIPRLPLPAEAGTKILAVFAEDRDGVTVVLTRNKDGIWHDRGGIPYYADEIVRWALLPEGLDWREVSE